MIEELLGAAPRYPERVVCLTEETTEILYRLGLGERVVGVSGFTVRPPEARQKPKVSTFLDANYERILDLEPDLVLGFSDLQADIARELARRGVPVYVFNQRSLAEILQAVRLVGALVGEAAAGEALAQELEDGLRAARRDAERLPGRPRVFFEEWPDPLIAGIRWVSELVELAGGEDVCRECRSGQAAAERTYEPAEIARRDPELVLASWCGKRVVPERIRSRPGWDGVAAVRSGRIAEIDSSIVLQPGPAALTDGLAAIAQEIRRAAEASAAERDQ